MLRVRLGSHPCSKQHSCWCAASSAPYRRALPLPRPTYPVRTQVDSYCKDTSQRIVGYYQANELADDTELGPFGKKIAALIRSKCPEAVCLLYQGASGPPTPDDLRFWSLGPDGKRTGPTPTLPDAPKTLPVLEGTLRRFTALVDLTSILTTRAGLAEYRAARAFNTLRLGPALSVSVWVWDRRKRPKKGTLSTRIHVSRVAVCEEVPK